MLDVGNISDTSLPRHLVRGVLGFGTIIGSLVLIPIVGVYIALLAPVGLLVLRGCPTCWAIGLVRIVSRGRLERRCVDGRCALASPAKSSGDTVPEPKAETARRGQAGGRVGHQTLTAPDSGNSRLT
jgi:hypothetical protein